MQTTHTTMTTTTTAVTTTEGVTVLDPATETAIAEFNNVKAALKTLEGRKSELDAQLRASLGDNTVGSINGVERIRVVPRNNSKIDREALKAAWPEAYEACLVETPYTILQAK